MFKNHVSILFISIVILIGCKNNQNKEKDTRTVFRYNEMSGITSLDPAQARTFENIWAVNQLFNGLVEMDDSLHIIPSIAKRWEIFEEGKKYTFYLRNDVFFHDDDAFENKKGRKVTAKDFELSFFRLFDPSVSAAGSLLQNIDRSERSQYKGFIAENDTTLHIYLKEAFTPFLGILTMKYFSVVPYEVIEHYGLNFRNHPIGTGPFKFKYWDEGNKLVFLKNENYFENDEHNNKLPYLDAVTISFIKDKETAFLEFMKGKYDMVSGIDAINREDILSKNGELKAKYADKFYLQTIPFLKTDYLGFLIDEKLAGNKNYPVTLKSIRKAINYAFDRKKLIQYLRGNLGTPATSGFIPRGLPSYSADEVIGYTYDPEKAKQLLKDVGFENGKGLPPITLHTTSQYMDICEFIQSQVAEVGIQIKIESEKAVYLSEAIASASVPFFRKSWIADYPDAENFLSVFYSKNFSPNGFNYTHFKNNRFDELYEKANSERIDSTRYSYYREMDRLVIEEAPIVPLYYDQVVRIVQKNILGLSPNPTNLLNLKRVKKVN